ncbi:MAG: hypothetical protein HQL08_12745 [Nitrospirae bacterium]|nr:hypothetical protein [Nitrospirota bacterium]
MSKMRIKYIVFVLTLVALLPLIYASNTGAYIFLSDGATHTGAGTGYLNSGWGLPTTASFTNGLDSCLYCHKPYSMGGSASDKSTYLLTGHKNMSRVLDGQSWGMPGVSASSPASDSLSGASLGSDGTYLKLWTQEDYPRMSVDWTNKLVSLGVCVKDASGVVSTGDVPDLNACPTCESPVMGNGAAGYPFNYPDQTSCESAKNPATGKATYKWVAYFNLPIYWIYGGAGLEGGPPMMETGSQSYKCGRCHTTGWTANHTTDDISSKHPQSDFPSVNFKSLTAIGSSTLLLQPSTAGASSTDVSSWDQWGIQCSRCHIATTGANNGHATWPTLSTKGGDINALCMNCHRQESDTAPRVGASTAAATTYTNKQAQPDGFAHHPDGNEFLNSPHAKFTGTWSQMGCPPYAINGYSSITPYAPGAPTDCTVGTMNLDGNTSSMYTSKFAQAAKWELGVSDMAAGSCVTCHDVHKTTNNNTTGMGEGAVVACTDCHSKSSGAVVSPQVAVSKINHPSGKGTPLENASTNPNSACGICHQPPGIKHIWRISTNQNYTTYGDYTHVDPPSSNVNPSNTLPDGSYTGAVWIDVDIACGQCHGGGVSSSDIKTTSTAAISGKSYQVSVANTSGFASGKAITISGAGVAGADFKTVIASVDKTSKIVYLTYATPAVASAASGTTVTVVGNSTANGAPYLTKSQLAALAKGLHGDSNNSCAATLNSDFSIHIPYLTYNGSSYSMDLTSVSGTWNFSVSNYSSVTNSSSYSGCYPATLSSTFELYIPNLMFQGDSLWMDLTSSSTALQGATFSYKSLGAN